MRMHVRAMLIRTSTVTAEEEEQGMTRAQQARRYNVDVTDPFIEELCRAKEAIGAYRLHPDVPHLASARLYYGTAKIAKTKKEEMSTVQEVTMDSTLDAAAGSMFANDLGSQFAIPGFLTAGSVAASPGAVPSPGAMPGAAAVPSPGVASHQGAAPSPDADQRDDASASTLPNTVEDQLAWAKNLLTEQKEQQKRERAVARAAKEKEKDEFNATKTPAERGADFSDKMLADMAASSKIIMRLCNDKHSSSLTDELQKMTDEMRAIYTDANQLVMSKRDDSEKFETQVNRATEVCEKMKPVYKRCLAQANSLSGSKKRRTKATADAVDAE